MHWQVKAVIVVSSCLAGLKVRYDGGHCLDDKIGRLVKEKKAITVCPEVLGGLPTPRVPAEIVGGDGEDVLDGKARVINESTLVILKENSPSCGSSMIYNGEFTGEKIAGNGVTAALLKRNGIKVVSEDRAREQDMSWE